MDVYEAIAVARRYLAEHGNIQLDEAARRMVPIPEPDDLSREAAEAYNILANLHQRVNLRDW